MIQLFCLVCAWSLVGLFSLTIYKVTKEGLAHIKRLHQIPCSNCAFFTKEYCLKCTVHPIKALSEEAINCRDFEPSS